MPTIDCTHNHHVPESHGIDAHGRCLTPQKEPFAMTPEEYERIRQLFHSACDLEPEERRAFLERECGYAPTLLAEVEALLAGDESVRRGSADASPSTLDAPRPDLSGEGGEDEHPERIGPYRILDVLGEGGMGVVYLAEQREPIRRRVALKVIKLGMDTREVVARFEAERQALAVMEHPGIARVFDAGTTEDGRPYFLMEFVQGLRITKYCDRNKLNLRERLELFRQVCRAMEHAHARGVVHRDLKPSNILVSRLEGEAVCKVIDFGVAKATNHRLTEKTVYTRLGRVVGTPTYMSPEQARGTGEDVDPRADVYSLGVVLYELLIGHLPVDWEVLRKASYEEIQRRIREEEPALPSTRWGRLNEKETTALATRRGSTPTAVARSLRGDLDWIVMKALEKEARRRYRSAAELADDVRRHLDGEAVLASPPSATYRLRKFARRHRGPVAAAAAFVAIILLGLGVSLFFYVEATNSRETVERQLVSILRLADQRKLENLEARARELWPPSSAMIEPLEAWLVEAYALHDRLPEHREGLAELRRRESLPYSEAERRRDRETHPQAPLLESLEEEAAPLETTLARLAETGVRPGHATLLPSGAEADRRVPTVYFRRAFEVEDISRIERLETTVFVDDGAVVYLNGSEVARINLAGGPVSHDTHAAASVEDDPARNPVARPLDLESLRAGPNVIAVEVHQAAWESPDLYFALELTARTARAPSVVLVSRGDSWQYDAWEQQESEREPERDWAGLDYDSSRWKRGAAPLGYGFEAGPGLAEETASRLRDLRGTIAALEAEVSERRTWTFSHHEVEWRHDLLVDLVASLEAFSHPFQGALASVERRLELARAQRRVTLEEHREAWDEAVRAIAAGTVYRGLEIEPQEGLIPLGPDPDTELWEFAHFLSGEPAQRGPDGKLAWREESGIVLVLIPPGEFSMGAERPSRELPLGSPNIDPLAEPRERPVHLVTIPQAYFLSKYEVTQAQWGRWTGTNPSVYDDHALFPVDSVSWPVCDEFLRQVGLTFPTEEEWEYAARAGSSTPWWTGLSKDELARAANLADISYHGSAPTAAYDGSLEDGFAIPAQVGSLRANGFGLHDVLGNVAEWCGDAPIPYGVVARRGEAESSTRERAVRGGAWIDLPRHARSASRASLRPATTAAHVGLRPARRLAGETDDRAPARRPTVETRSRGIILEAEDMATTRGDHVQRHGDGILFGSNGTIEQTFEVEESGEHLLEVLARGNSVDGELPVFEVVIDGRVPARRSLTVESEEFYPVEVDLEAGLHRIALSFLNDKYCPRPSCDPPVDRNLFVDRVVIFRRH